MGNVIKSSGEYKSKTSGETVGYEFEYVAFTDLNDAIELLGEPEVLKRVQRMTKVDASNTAREAAKTANGDSTRKAMSEEDKAERKAERASNKALLDKLKKLSPAQREALGL